MGFGLKNPIKMQFFGETFVLPGLPGLQIFLYGIQRNTLYFTRCTLINKRIQYFKVRIMKVIVSVLVQVDIIQYDATVGIVDKRCRLEEGTTVLLLILRT